MAFTNFTDAVDEKLSLIASALGRIEKGGQASELSDLALHLVDALGLFQRNPGIEAAAQDLFSAAVALSEEHGVTHRPVARMERLVREAHTRFRSRLEAAVERIGPYEHLVVPAFPIRAAA